MRILGTFLLGAGLLVPGLGCSRTMQHTAGICDCDPPPVQSLLVTPSAGHPSLGVYGGVAHTPLVADQGNLPRVVETVPVGPRGIESVPVMPRGVETVPIMPKEVTPMR